MVRKFIGVALVALASTTAQAGVLFSDSLQGSLATSNWIGNSNGQITSAPTGGNALNFTNTRGGGDLFSKIITGTGVGTYTLKVDYLCQNANGCAGFIGLHPGGSVNTTPYSQGYDNWLVTDAPQTYPTPFTFSTSSAGFVTNTFNFTVSSGGQFGLKPEDFSGTAGDAYFRNISLSSGAVPEPAAWALMLGGFGMMGAAVRRRRSQASVKYA